MPLPWSSERVIFTEPGGSKRLFDGSGDVIEELVRSSKKRFGCRTSKGNLLDQFLGLGSS